MSSVLAALKVVLGLDTGPFQKGATQAQAEAQKMVRSIEATGKRIAGLGAGISAGITVPLLGLMKSAIPAAQESAQAISQVTAALASMGPVAGRNAQQLQDQAAALMKMSLFDDDEILQKVTANLLTFGNVSGPVFDRAQQAIVDTATRLKMDLQPATLMVGKALNDPVGGLMALKKVGAVNDEWVKSNKGVIAGLVESGDRAKAQAMILAELERQTQGSAKAMRDATPGADLKNAWDDMQEAIGGVALDVLPKVLPAVTRVVEAFNNLSPTTQTAVVGFAAVAAAAGPMLLGLGAIVNTTAPFTAALRTIAAEGGPLLAMRSGITGLVSVINPWVLGIGAATAAIVWMDRQMKSSNDTIAGFNTTVGEADAYIAKLNAKATEGQGPQKAFGGAVDSARTRMAAAAAEASKLIDKLYGIEAAAFRAARALAQQRAQDAYNKINDLQKERDRIAQPGWQWGPGGLNEGRSQLILQRQLSDAKRDQIAAGKQLLTLDGDMARRAAEAGRAMVTAANGATAALDGTGAAGGRIGARTRKGTGDASQALKQLQEEAKSLMDRLFPEEAALREYQRSAKIIAEQLAQGKISAEKAEEALRRLRTGGVENPTQVNMEGAGDSIAGSASERIQAELAKLAEAANDNAKGIEGANKKIAESFATMARDTVDALGGLVNAIKGGDFLSILRAVVNMVEQLGAIGLFGQKVQANIKAAQVNYAQVNYAYANGTSWHPGGLALVGEQGPEVVNLPRGSSVTPNHALGFGGGVKVVVEASPYFDARVQQNIGQAAPAIASAGAQAGERRALYRRSRMLGA